MPPEQGTEWGGGDDRSVIAPIPFLTSDKVNLFVIAEDCN